jgi:hypothetical protein
MQLGRMARPDGDMKITPLKAVMPDAAEDLTDRLYGMIPNARITSLLAEAALLILPICGGSGPGSGAGELGG